MPIRPENKDRYEVPSWASVHVSTLLDAEELAAVELMSSRFGHDVVRTFGFWESMVTMITAGKATSHSCPWDVELPYGDRQIRIEVKYARQHLSKYRDASRNVFKFANPKGRGAQKAADVIVLIGIHDLDRFSTWAIPAAMVRKCKSITLNLPHERRGSDRSRGIGGYLCPPDQLLPEILRSYRERLLLGDAPAARAIGPHHAKRFIYRSDHSRIARSARTAAMVPLFDAPTAGAL